MTDQPTEAEIKKQATIFTQAQAGYITLSNKQAQACANCVFFRDTGYDGVDWQHCHLVEAYPEPILPTGICNEWRAKPEPPPELTEQIGEALAEVVEDAAEQIADAVTSSMPSVVTVSAEKKTPARQSIVERVKQLITPPKTDDDSSFEIEKGIDGKWYWIAKYTNAYEDKDGEIFTEAAHENFIRNIDMGLVDKPELWTYHLKGTKHGKADTVFGAGRIVTAVGHFDDTPEAQKAVKFYQKNASKIKLSHGATAPKWAIKDGVITQYNTFEISTLPNGAEANPYTSYEAVKSMQPDPKKLEWVAAVLGKEKAEEIVQSSEKLTKELDEMYVRYKDFAQTGETPAPAPSTEAQQNMGETFVEMVKEQGQIVELLAAMEKRQNASDELIKSLTKEVTDAKAEAVELRKVVNAGPRSPSQDNATKAADEEASKAKEKLESAAPDKSDPFAAYYKQGDTSNGHA